MKIVIWIPLILLKVNLNLKTKYVLKNILRNILRKIEDEVYIIPMLFSNV